MSLKSETDGLFTSSFLPALVKLRLKFWPKLLMGDLSDGVTRPVETLEDFVFVDSFDSGLRKEMKNTELLKNRHQKWKCRSYSRCPLTSSFLLLSLELCLNLKEGKSSRWLAVSSFCPRLILLESCNCLSREGVKLLSVEEFCPLSPSACWLPLICSEISRIVKTKATHSKWFLSAGQ